MKRRRRCRRCHGDGGAAKMTLSTRISRRERHTVTFDRTTKRSTWTHRQGRHLGVYWGGHAQPIFVRGCSWGWRRSNY